MGLARLILHLRRTTLTTSTAQPPGLQPLGRSRLSCPARLARQPAMRLQQRTRPDSAARRPTAKPGCRAGPTSRPPPSIPPTPPGITRWPSQACVGVTCGLPARVDRDVLNGPGGRYRQRHTAPCPPAGSRTTVWHEWSGLGSSLATSSRWSPSCCAGRTRRLSGRQAAEPTLSRIRCSFSPSQPYLTQALVWPRPHRGVRG